MDWAETLQRAIDYIEAHLEDKLSPEVIAAQAYVSSFHFQRAFSLLTDRTLGEYIRDRRLTLAGQALANSDQRVIDVAYRFGYDSPESFSKAFQRFHGISPGFAKLPGAPLRSMGKLSVKIILEGGIGMDYRIEKRDAFDVLAVTKTFGQENSSQEIPLFWDEYFERGLQKKVCPGLGICHQAPSGGPDFLYSIGDECKKDAPVPEGFQRITIPAHTWAAFPCVGPMPKAIQDMWTRVYSEWLPESEYVLVPDYDMEVYSAGDPASSDYRTEIWIPIEKKQR